MRRAFLHEISFPQEARVLDVGCGTGVLTRVLARWPNVASVVGIDPAPALLEKARAAAADMVCVDAMMANSVTDRRIMRRLTNVVAACGFDVVSFRSFGFAEIGNDGYMLTVVDRGADILCSQGHIGQETAAALKEEARRRLRAGRFFGHIAYAGLIARKP
jgi:SAM-dependent methyltransferase